MNFQPAFYITDWPIIAVDCYVCTQLPPRVRTITITVTIKTIACKSEEPATIQVVISILRSVAAFSSFTFGLCGFILSLGVGCNLYDDRQLLGATLIFLRIAIFAGGLLLVVLSQYPARCRGVI